MTTEKESLLEFTARLIELRRDHPNLRRRKFFQDQEIRSSRDLSWYGTDGKELDAKAWESGWGLTLGMMLNGQTLGVSDELGNPVTDESFLLLLNAHHEAVDFTLPPSPEGRQWKCILKQRPRKAVLLGPCAQAGQAGRTLPDSAE